MFKPFMAAVTAGMMAFAFIPDGQPQLPPETNERQIGEEAITITDPGRYVLTGEMKGAVYVDPGQGEVELVLDGADINNPDGPGIVILSGDAVKIELPEGSVNRVSDGGQGMFDAAIYSEADLSFEGNGALYINGNNAHGIHAENADLAFNGGSFAIRAEDTGIVGDPQFRTEFNGGMFDFEAPTNIDQEADPFMNGSQFMPGNEVPGMEGTQAPAEGSAPMNGEMPAQEGGMPADMQNGAPEMNGGAMNDMSSLSSTDTAGEIVYGTSTNSAAELEADYENAVYITVTDDENEVTITSSGTYVVTGTCSDGNIVVKKGTTGVVLVLQDLDLTSTTGAAVSVNKNAEVQIIISGTVTLTDNENPDDEYSEDEDVADAYDGAALKVKADSVVFITGDGTLSIVGNANNGIKAGDDSSLIFDGEELTVNITAANDGINGNYDVTLLSGTYTISAGDDAIHADHILTIGDTDSAGPTINITDCVEGLEGTVVNILGGNISITSSDDAVNAANGDGLYEGVLDYSVNMTGGTLTISSQGDGIDSNGNVNLVDGTAVISSSAGAGEAGIDYDGELYISEDYSLSNKSGTAGPDNMGGEMNNQMQPGQNGFFPQGN